MTRRTALLLGIDVGTSSSKAVILDMQGHEVSAASAPHPVRSPRRGWAETDPADWWGSVGQAVQAALEGSHSGAEDPGAVAAVGLSGQMHGAVLADADGNPVRPAVLWADERAEKELARYRDLDAASMERLGNPLVAGMTGPVLCWLSEFEPESYRRATWVLQSKDWLRFRLTDHAGSEHSDASATLLYDLVQRRWADEVIDALGLRRDSMARIGLSGESAGELTDSAAEALGLRAGTVVAYGAADVPAALVGTGLAEPGALQLTVGTAAQVATLREEPRPDKARRYHVFAAATGGYYALAAVQAAGLAFEWAWGALGCDWRCAYEALAQSPPGANGVSFVPHVAGARSPSMDARAAGAFCGLRLSNDRSDLMRSVFEGVAFSILEAARALPEYEAAPQVRLAGGGTLDPAWRQLLADVLDRPLVVLRAVNASARGAAVLGGLAANLGLPPDEEPTSSVPQSVVYPHHGHAVQLADAYGRWAGWSAALAGRNTD
jgi:xylulokinase